MATDELRRYFEHKRPLGAIALIVFGAIILMLGILARGGYVWKFAGLGVTALGIYLTVKFGANCSDSTVDNYCADLANKYYAAKKTAVDSQKTVSDTICSCGYCFENIFSARRAVRGRDNIWRSSIFEMSCMFFSEETVYYCNEKISLITDEKNEKQSDFKLRDIQMVSLEEKNRSWVVSVVIPGNKNVYINCKNKEEATNLCDRLKEKV